MFVDLEALARSLAGPRRVSRIARRIARNDLEGIPPVGHGYGIPCDDWVRQVFAQNSPQGLSFGAVVDFEGELVMVRVGGLPGHRLDAFAVHRAAHRSEVHERSGRLGLVPVPVSRIGAVGKRPVHSQELDLAGCHDWLLERLARRVDGDIGNFGRQVLLQIHRGHVQQLGRRLPSRIQHCSPLKEPAARASNLLTACARVRLRPVTPRVVRLGRVPRAGLQSNRRFRRHPRLPANPAPR